MEDVTKYLENLLAYQDCVVLALSGGGDSMCLLTLLKTLKLNLHIICAHVNHHTRANNQKEAEFIKKYLDEENITLEYYEIDGYKNNRFTEQEARTKRYQFLKATCEKYHAQYLLTAHHSDDLVETIIMRIIRGSTLEGYAGIKKESHWDNTTIIRPFLNISKNDIYAYLKEKNIPYMEDETNKDDNFLRNRIRHHMIPLLEQEEKKYYLKFLKFSETLNRASRVINKLTEENLQRLKEKDKIKRKEFLELDEDLQELVLNTYFKNIYGTKLNLITQKHISKSLDFIKQNNKALTINLPDKEILYKNEYYFWLTKKQEKDEYCIKCERKTILPNGSRIELIDTYEEKSNYEIHLNSKNIELPLYLITRKKGLKMAVKNLNGHKKVNDILIDEKISNELRDEIPIMVDNKGTVLWILGISKSKYDLAKNENYDIIYKYIKRKEL